jgi:hypothetical protein
VIIALVMLCFLSLQSWFVRFFRLGLACFFCWCSGGVNAVAGDVKINGLHFTLGEPIDHPVAKVTIAELVQGAKKRGFLRISLLPVALAKGMEIRFLRPEIAVLKEVQETLRSMVKLEAQELRGVQIFVGDETAPRLVAGEALPKGEIWELKRVRIRQAEAIREFEVCTLSLAGERAGELSSGGGGVVLRLDLAQGRE